MKKKLLVPIIFSELKTGQVFERTGGYHKILSRRSYEGEPAFMTSKILRVDSVEETPEAIGGHPDLNIPCYIFTEADFIKFNCQRVRFV
jgi:hypothetical protein